MNKSTILSKIDEKSIYFKYLGINEIPKKNISSPFSEDKNPSFSMFEKNGKLLYTCHSTGKHGDCFQLLCDLNNLNFNEALNKIAEDFSINSKENHFKINKTPFSDNHLNWWLQGNWRVNQLILDNYNVSSINSYEYYCKHNKDIKRIQLSKEVLAFYYEAGDKGEIYIPQQLNRPKKFAMNKLTSSFIFGLEQLGKCDYVIIAAGKKDCLILNANGFPSVCFRSENTHVTKAHIQSIKEKTNNIFLLYDNDDSGQNFAKKIIEKHNLKGLKLPSQYNDVAEYFKVYNKDAFNELLIKQKKIKKVKKDLGSNTIFHQVEDYISSNYDIRFNKLDLDLEISDKSLSNWEFLKVENLYIELKKLGYKFSINDLQILLRSDFVKHYDPLKEYFLSLPKWDGKIDYINKLASYVEAEKQERFQYHFKKWCVRTVKCAIDDNYFNKQAFILSDNGVGQNIGKSSWCRFLTPKVLKRYIAEDFSNNDKDSRILLCKNFMINLDELASLNKKEINTLKSMFSKTQINERLPYDRKNSILPRKASFIGSTNQTTFLNDETGSVRWLCFVIKSIDWNYSTEINIDNLWSQAFSLINDSDFEYNMTRKDIEENEIENSQFKIVSLEEDLISQHYQIGSPGDGDFMSSAEIIRDLSFLGHKLNSVSIGRALTSLGYPRKTNKQRYGYWVKGKKFHH